MRWVVSACLIYFQMNMKNEASQLITDSLLGLDFKTVILGGKGYSIHPPTIKVICRGLGAWSKIDFNSDEEQTKANVIAQIRKCHRSIIDGLASFIVGNSKLWKWRAYKISKELENCTSEELNIACRTAVDLIGAEHFFACATLCKNVTKMVAKQK